MLLILSGIFPEQVKDPAFPQGWHRAGGWKTTTQGVRASRSPLFGYSSTHPPLQMLLAWFRTRSYCSYPPLLLFSTPEQTSQQNSQHQMIRYLPPPHVGHSIVALQGGGGLALAALVRTRSPFVPPPPSCPAGKEKGGVGAVAGCMPVQKQKNKGGVRCCSWMQISQPRPLPPSCLVFTSTTYPTLVWLSGFKPPCLVVWFQTTCCSAPPSLLSGFPPSCRCCLSCLPLV